MANWIDLGTAAEPLPPDGSTNVWHNFANTTEAPAVWLGVKKQNWYSLQVRQDTVVLQQLRVRAGTGCLSGGCARSA